MPHWLASKLMPFASLTLFCTLLTATFVTTTTKFKTRMHHVGYDSSFVHFALLPCLPIEFARSITVALLSMHKPLTGKQLRAYRDNQLHVPVK
eukprot:2390198-Karenia_brevis.AAC.1